ncbi:MAG TPA: type II toxin-antitoxin system VapC family toxin [Xanthobacteraceae bacterium]
MILLDTHVAIWILRNDAALGKKARDAAMAALAEAQLVISAISFWEIALLIAKGRLRSLDDPDETRRSMLRAGVRELPLTGQIAILAVQLETLHGDPADRFIAATALAHAAALMTADETLLAWRSKLTRIDAER